MLKRIKKVSAGWIKPGHLRGQNTHNISATISVKEEEWEQVSNWMWENKGIYNGLSILPYAEHTYKQAPFEDCTEKEYNELYESLQEVDVTKIIEIDDNTNLAGEVACAGGACEINLI